MNSGDRLKALFWVWAAFALAIVATVGSSPMQVETVVIAFFIVIAALVATRFITSAAGEHIQETSKAKTRRVDRMLASLNDEELDVLRQRLSSDDGELVSLEDVLRKERRQ
jgi:membrane protein implicated in regulation of membrane protease activity